MATEIGHAYLTIIPSMKGAAERIGDALGGIDTTPAGETMGRRASDGFANGLLKGAVIGAAAEVTRRAMSAIGGSISGAISRVDTLNNYTNIMGNLGFGAEDAARSLDVMVDKLNGLPTSLDAMASMVQQLAPLTGSLTSATDVGLAFNNMLLASGKSAFDQSRAMAQYTQMLSTGVADIQSWRAVQEVIPAQLDQMAAAMLGAGSKSMDLYAALKSGEVTFEDFNETMMRLNTEGFGEFASFEQQAIDATQGIGTAVTNMSTRIRNATAKIIQAFGAENISGAINAISSTFGTIADQFVPVATAAGNAFGKLVDAFNSLPTNVRAIFVETALGASVLTMALLRARFVMENNAAVAGAVGKAYSTLSNNIRMYVGVLRGSAAAESAMALSGKTMSLNALTAARGVGQKATAAIRSAAATAADTAAGIANALVNNRVAYAAWTAQIKVTALASAHKVAMIAALGVIGVIAALAFALHSTGGDADALAAKITAFSDKAVEAINGFTEALPGMIEGFTTAALHIIDSMTTLIPSVVQSVAAAIPSLVGAISAMIPALLEAALSIVDALTVVLPQVIEAIVGALPMLVGAVVSGLATVVPALVNAVVSIVQAVVAMFPVLIPALLNAAITLFMALVDALPVILVALVDGVGSIIEQLGAMLPDLIPVILSAAVTLFMAIVQAVPQIVGALVASVASLVTSAYNTIVGMRGRIVEAGSNLIRGLWQGIQNVKQWIFNQISAFCDGIVDKVRSLFGIHSPSRVFALIGEFLGLGLARGIESSTAAVSQAASRMFMAARGAVGSVDAGASFRTSARGMAYAGALGGGGDTYIINGIDYADNNRMRAAFGEMLGELNRLRRA